RLLDQDIFPAKRENHNNRYADENRTHTASEIPMLSVFSADWSPSTRSRDHDLLLNSTVPKVINTKAVPAGPRYTPCASHSLQARAAIGQASASVHGHSAEVRRAILSFWP